MTLKYENYPYSDDNIFYVVGTKSLTKFEKSDIVISSTGARAERYFQNIHYDSLISLYCSSLTEMLLIQRLFRQNRVQYTDEKGNFNRPDSIELALPNSIQSLFIKPKLWTAIVKSGNELTVHILEGSRSQDVRAHLNKKNMNVVRVYDEEEVSDAVNAMQDIQIGIVECNNLAFDYDKQELTNHLIDYGARRGKQIITSDSGHSFDLAMIFAERFGGKSFIGHYNNTHGDFRTMRLLLEIESAIVNKDEVELDLFSRHMHRRLDLRDRVESIGTMG